ncbi:MAG TPA: zinc ribbon domain-containing protein [Vicinamibacterales bacterium]|nr:zinc ribbon domain-containing protein [Vicinamibacterales bacterium]
MTEPAPGMDAGNPFPESSATAREEFHCPACGAEAHWNPTKQALVCPFCGTESPATLEGAAGRGKIVEHDLVAALRGIPDDARGWKAVKISVKCQSCQAISVFDPEKVGQRCEFCGSSSLVPYEQVKDAFRPESLLPLKVSEPNARDLIRAWYGRQWFAPNAFRMKALTDTVRAVYLPYWTFDAAVHADWTATAGDYYYVQQGKNRVRKVRWYPAAGSLDHVFDDELICASVGVSRSMLEKVEPFPTSELVPYDAGFVSGWTVERYQIDLVKAAEESRRRMDAEIRDRCAADVPGDTHRDLQVAATYSGQTFKHILGPVWLLTYTYRAHNYQVIVNGVTGRIAGSRPYSWIKIALLVLAILIVVLIIAAANN